MSSGEMLESEQVIRRTCGGGFEASSRNSAFRSAFLSRSESIRFNAASPDAADGGPAALFSAWPTTSVVTKNKDCRRAARIIPASPAWAFGKAAAGGLPYQSTRET